MSHNWKELAQQKRRELIVSGEAGIKQIEAENGLNEILFKLESLNFLEISKVSLSNLSEKIANLTNLTNLVLSGNEFAGLPSEIGKLKKLKLLDLSNNQLVGLPDSLGELEELQSLVLTNNKLTTLPDSVSKLGNLTVIKFAQNEFKKFPDCLCNESLKHMAEICAAHNQIGDIPHSIGNLTALKVLDLSDNSILIVPGELASCSKLKELNLKGNKLSDRRLLKIVEQGKQKQIMDYIKSSCPKEKKSDSVNNANEKTKGKENQDGKTGESGESQDVLKVLSVVNDQMRLVTATPVALDMRKIVCCIVRNVDLKREGLLRRFISLQTNMHDGICGKRQFATIATHDLEKINGLVTFELKPPTKMTLLPLGRTKEMTAAELYKTLNLEADLYRKEKKRTTYSGIHKYLYLLKGKQRYPCLTDQSGVVISFPPLTNSSVTKITEETQNMFIEVTGESVPKCKEVMDALLHAMLKLGLGKPLDPDPSGQIPTYSLLQIEPVKVVDPEGKLYVVYPSRVDLNFDTVNVVREHQ